jgi:predicted nuclease of restriction endonuclease-like (RecB) superfamily
MMQFAEGFSDPKIVATLSQQLTWSHVVELLPLKDSLQRDFYAEMCRLENWSVRTLRAKIDGMLFERTGLSRKPAETCRAGTPSAAR